MSLSAEQVQCVKRCRSIMTEMWKLNPEDREKYLPLNRKLKAELDSANLHIDDVASEQEAVALLIRLFISDLRRPESKHAFTHRRGEQFLDTSSVT